MSQSDILKLLSVDKWVRSTDINAKLGTSRATINNSIRKLLKEGDIVRRPYRGLNSPRNKSEYEYKLNIIKEQTPIHLNTGFSM